MKASYYLHFLHRRSLRLVFCCVGRSMYFLCNVLQSKTGSRKAYLFERFVRRTNGNWELKTHKNGRSAIPPSTGNLTFSPLYALNARKRSINIITKPTNPNNPINPSEDAHPPPNAYPYGS